MTVIYQGNDIYTIYDDATNTPYQFSGEFIDAVAECSPIVNDLKDEIKFRDYKLKEAEDKLLSAKKVLESCISDIEVALDGLDI